VVVVTVYSSEEVRAQESKQWCAHVGARWMGLGHQPSGATGLAKDDPTPEPLAADAFPAELSQAGAVRLWPLGLHPDHRAVADAAPAGDLRYLDTPYQVDLYQQAAVRDALLGRTIVWWQRPPRKKWEHVGDFASQAFLFDVWSPDKLELVPEIVVR
jgi:hypothetical protein